MKGTSLVPPLLPRGTFGGCPSRFKGWCATAAEGGSSGGYRVVGRNFAGELLQLEPHNLVTDEWFSVVARMVDSCFPEGMDVDRDGLVAWLRRHFPLMMKLVPVKRVQQFVDGVIEAYDEGEMLADFPSDFEPVEVDLEDPCGGEGCIQAIYHRPFLREVVYQCPAPSCREASGRAIEKYAAGIGQPVFREHGTLVTMRGLSQLASR